ncbi:MAG: hypothetical protein SWK76_04660 [Actinomycetota bacterium]|nr:hypothetical protein [Actinomycetota bacterium]
MESIRGKTAIVGIGEVPTGVHPERSFIERAVAVSEMAILDSGMDKSEIDTIIPIVVVADPVDNANMICSWLVEGMGREVLMLPADVSDYEAVRDMIGRALEKVGNINILVNMAD